MGLLLKKLKDFKLHTNSKTLLTNLTLWNKSECSVNALNCAR